jgi:hypothetical protein
MSEVEQSSKSSGNKEIPSIYIYIIEMLETLRAFGGEATSDEVCDWFRHQGIAREKDLATVQKHGETRFRKEVRFARLALAKAGLLEGNDPGHWQLSPLGWNARLDLGSARAIANGRPTASVSVLQDWIEELGDVPEIGAGGSPTKGPSPTAWEGLVRRGLATRASTYVMRFGATSIWKIGFASNLTARLAELNRHIPVEVLNCCWSLVREQRWPDPKLAYEMEQRVLAELRDSRTTGERVRCSEKDLNAAWERAIG